MGSKKIKFYAVKVGTVPGIYGSWAECEPLVRNFPGAKFKSFPSEEEARAYLEGDCALEKAPTPKTTRPAATEKASEEEFVVPQDTLVAFVDGSYDAQTHRYGYGCVLLTTEGVIKTENGVGDHPEAVSARNVAGELQGTLVALKRAEELGYKKVLICHDYTGIAAWFLGEWRANTFVSKQYIAAAEAYRGVLEVSFRKIAAHTGVTYNEMADRLAKAALGIGE